MERRFAIDHPALVDLLYVQDGLVCRRQLIDLGALPQDVQRMVRRRELTRQCNGVYVNHTGPLTPRQRDWAAVLAAWPAALTGPSVLPGPRPAQVHIAVPRGRHVRTREGVVVRHTAHLDDRVLWQRSPPRMRVEDALIDELSRHITCDDLAGAFAVLASTLQSRGTTPARILDVLAGRRRVPGRALISAMLTDARDGVCSVLERGYRSEVERAHGLPRASRQHRSGATGATTYQDVRYVAWGLVVELDGHAFHSSAQARDRDAARDLAELATSSAATARLTYGLVFAAPCRTAWWIAQILRARGWQGDFHRCPVCPAQGY